MYICMMKAVPPARDLKTVEEANRGEGAGTAIFYAGERTNSGGKLFSPQRGGRTLLSLRGTHPITLIHAIIKQPLNS